MRTLGWFVATALVITAGGCAAEPRIDATGVADAITTELQPHLDPETITSVECPDDVAPESGAQFTCVAHAADVSFDVEVTQENDDGKIEFAPTDAVVVTAGIEADLDSRLHEAYDQPGDVMDLDVDCGGPRVRLLTPGDTFDCEVTADGSIFTERVSVVDTAGTVNYLVVE